MSIPLALWLVILAALLAVYVYRKMVSSNADELVHLSDATDAVLSKQENIAAKIQQLDRIVMILAIVFVVYGVIFGGFTIYRALA